MFANQKIKHWSLQLGRSVANPCYLGLQMEVTIPLCTSYLDRGATYVQMIRRRTELTYTDKC